MLNESIRKEIIEIVKLYIGNPVGCHDLSHTVRVKNSALYLSSFHPEVDASLLEVAAYFHDTGRGLAEGEVSHGVSSGKLVIKHLPCLGFSNPEVDVVYEAVIEHPYSIGRKPSTLMGKILQDADRLDALGAIGIARVFTEGAGRNLYDEKDPFAKNRDLDGKKYVLDNFYIKILRLYDTLHTDEAKRIAHERVKFTLCFLEKLETELRYRPV